jgi:transcriptional regulator with XRE-family HTH domain
MDAAELLREVRSRHGVSQRSLARRCRTSQTYISRIERGDISPSFNALNKLLQAMGERLELSAVPRRGNQSTDELRADFEQLSPGERIAQAAELSYVLTGLAAGAGGDRR